MPRHAALTEKANETQSSPSAAQRRKVTQASQTLLWVTSSCRQPQNMLHFLNLCLGRQQQVELVAVVFEVFRHHSRAATGALRLRNCSRSCHCQTLSPFSREWDTQGMACREKDSMSKLEAVMDWKKWIYFFPLLFRKRQIAENKASQQGHLRRQDGSFGALLWSSCGTSEPHEHSRWQGSGSTQAQGHWKPLGYGFVVGYPCITACISSKSPYRLITWEIPLNTVGKHLILGISMAASPVHTAVL